MEHGQSKLDFKKYTKQIWLAGLGAFSKAEEEDNTLFDSLVQTGAELEEKSHEIVDNDLPENKRSTITKQTIIGAGTRDKLEKWLDYAAYQSLKKLGLVTGTDLKKLENLVLELHKKIDLLVEENKVLKNNINQK